MIAEILSAWRELAVEDSSMKIIEGCINYKNEVCLMVQRGLHQLNQTP